MTDPLLYDGRLHAPFFIFIRTPHEYSDADILACFSLDSYRPAREPSRRGRHAIIADAGAWTMLADDWHYTLWHMKTTRPTIEAIAKRHEVFTCTEGDCDRSFDFAYYHKGRLARRYEVSSPHFTDRRVVEDFGTPLPGEAVLLKNDGCNIGIEVARALGIKTYFTADDLHIYLPPCDSA